jgi:hypothetical protein
MSEIEVSRTLVKSPPELWTELSNAASLGRHLNPLGEIRITRLVPETTVAWEGERVSGTVRLEPSGWGTRVILQARAADAESPAVATQVETAVTEPRPAVADSPIAEPRPAVADSPSAETASPRSRGRFMSRVRGWFGPRPAPPSAPEPHSEPAVPADVSDPPPTPDDGPTAATDAPEVDAVLAAALDSLGQAHHRPYSRQ